MSIEFSQITRFFEGCPLTKNWSVEERDILARSVEVSEVKAQKVIFWEGSTEKKIYFVFSGRLVVSKKIRGKIEEVVTRFGPGDFFGELSLVDDAPRSATVQTESDASLLILDHATWLEIERVHPAIASKFYRALLTELVVRLRKTTEKLQETIVWGMEASSLGEGEIFK